MTWSSSQPVAFLLVLAASRVVLAAAPPASIEEIAAGLAAEPRSLRELEAIVGFIDRDKSRWEEATRPISRSYEEGIVARVDVVLAIDIHHFDPREQDDAELASWLVELRDPAGVMLAALGQRRGEGSVLSHLPDRPKRFGRFVVRPGAEGLVKLSWSLVEPPWVQPARTPAQDILLQAQLGRLLASNFSPARVEAALPGLDARSREVGCAEATGSGWSAMLCTDRDGIRELSVTIVGEALRAERLVASLGLARPGFAAFDLHGANPQFVDLATLRRPERYGYHLDLRLEAAAPRRGVATPDPTVIAWEVEEWPLRSVVIERR